MSPRLIELHQQRGRLLERIAQQRLALATQAKPLLEVEASAARGIGLARRALERIEAHPLPALLAAATLLLLRPRRLWRGLRWGFWSWRRYRQLRALLPASWKVALGLRA